MRCLVESTGTRAVCTAGVWASILILGMGLAGCGDDGATASDDAGGTDAGEDASIGMDGGTNTGEADAGEADAGEADAGGADGGDFCVANEECPDAFDCCRVTGLCYDPRCASCCPGAPDDGGTGDDGGVPDDGGTGDEDGGAADAGPAADGGTEADCSETGCRIGYECCEASGLCYDPRCDRCCVSAGTDAGTEPDCTETGCRRGHECCEATGVCYDSRCGTCCSRG